MIQFYEQNSLIECFKDLDTTLETPYKQAEPTIPEENPPFPGRLYYPPPSHTHTHAQIHTIGVRSPHTPILYCTGADRQGCVAFDRCRQPASWYGQSQVWLLSQGPEGAVATWGRHHQNSLQEGPQWMVERGGLWTGEIGFAPIYNTQFTPVSYKADTFSQSPPRLNSGTCC